MSASAHFAPGRLSLAAHPDTPSAAVTGISVDAARGRNARAEAPAVLILRYVADLAQNTVVLPAPAAPERRDELWKHTCFEAFIRVGGEAYCEFNFSPSTEWAAYRFDGYRAGMAPLEIPPPRIMTIGGRAPRFEMRLSLDLGGLPELAAAPWRLALSAVIEEADGARSYWALAHPPGKPDFHHPDSFAIEVPVAERS